jgi:transcriptional regulator with GAF, ATPase, and Fis domain
MEAIVRVLKGTSDLELVEYDCDSPSSRRAFAMRVTPFRGSQGGVVVVHSNITQLKEAQESLRKALAELEATKKKTDEENVYLREREKLRLKHERVIGQSRVMREVLRLVEQVAVTDSTVLLLGETGTGKELLASCVHHSSSRRDRTLVSVNCAAMPAALVESELFGREKGAFTGSLARQVGRFELASGSTIFLDEVGELSLEVQGKLLRVLETRQIERLGNPRPITVDVRVIAATNRDLEQAVHEGKFRSDLYYRLNVFPISVPSLRERPEDIVSLVWAFVDEFAKRFNKNIQSIDKENLDALRAYSWPGNVRELRNLIERAMILASGPRLRIQLPPTGALHHSATTRKLEEVERQHILEILEKTGWRIRGSIGAAQQLGLKPTTLEARMAKLGIRRPRIAR